jgi:hypothetical protein
MPHFDPELVEVMREALEEVISKVPSEYSTPATKAYLAECILAQGQISWNELVAAATDQMAITHPEILKQPAYSRSFQGIKRTESIYLTARRFYLRRLARHTTVTDAVLIIDKLVVAFEALQAVDGVSISIPRGKNAAVPISNKPDF